MTLSRVKSSQTINRMLREAVDLYEIDTNPENFEELCWEYRKLLAQSTENYWARADLAHLAGKKYGGLRKLSIDSGDSYGFLRQLSYCAGQYEKSMRRMFKDLTFSHFRVVAHKEERYLLLQRAQNEHWSVSRLAQEAGPKEPDGVISIRRIVRILNSQPKEAYQGLDGMSLINLALSPVGKIKWTGKKFAVEELYE